MKVHTKGTLLIAAGAVVAAVVLIALAGDDPDPTASVRALGRAQEIAKRASRESLTCARGRNLAAIAPVADAARDVRTPHRPRGLSPYALEEVRVSGADMSAVDRQGTIHG